jgi:hypothetical protein
MLLALYLIFYEVQWSTLIISVEYLGVPFLQVLPVNNGLWNRSLSVHLDRIQLIFL